MCGIVGYAGNGNAVPILMDGLRRLEYRGYDSAGIGVIVDGRLEVRRSVGKIAALERVLAREPLKAQVGVAHTRWATHGRPSDRNAHPHRDCTGSIAVVHNGIIENYAALRRTLEAEGHRFASETDTEVIAHLLERYAGEGLAGAARRAAGALHGAYALGIVSAQAPGTLVGVREGGAPLVVAVGAHGAFLASDVAAVLPYTRDVMVLEDGELAVLSGRDVRIVGRDGRAVTRAMTAVPWDLAAAEKGGYPHFMLKEIHEQPRGLETTVRALRASEGERGLEREALAGIERVLILACGTSWHAGLIGKHLIETLAGLPVEVDIASEYRYRPALASAGTLALAISQSGETADTLGALRHAKACGARSLAVCNVVGASLTREADAVLYTRVGPEIGVASTKAFTGQLAVLYLFALRLGEARGTISAERGQGLREALGAVPRQMETVLAGAERIAALAASLAEAESVLYLGRGISHPVALEGALKLKELSYVHAEGYAAGEMKHGPIALVDPKLPVVVVAPRDRLHAKVLASVEEVKARNGVVVAVASAGDAELGARADHVLTVPATSELLTPFVTTLPLQLLAYHIAVLRGCDVDQPRNLAKSVTVE